MKQKPNKGMWKRTFGLYGNIKMPWHLYLIQVAIGIVSTNLSLSYLEYQNEIKLGNFENMSVVWMYVGLMLASVLMNIAVSIPKFYSENIVARNLQNKLISRSVRLPMRSVENNGSQIVSWITEDCSYADGLIFSLLGFITGIYSTVISTSKVLSMNVDKISSAMLIIVPVIFAYVIFSTWLEGKFMFLRQRRGRLADSELTAYMSEHLGFITQIKQLNSRKEEMKRGKEAIKKYYKADVYQAVLTIINNMVSGSLSSIISILVFVIGVPLVNSGAMELKQLADFEAFLLVAYQSISSVPGIYTSFMYYNGQLFYIAGLMAEKEEKYERSRSMDVPDESLTFENVSFGYSADKPVLKNASFTIPKGKTTVIAGPNGSGKTTIFKLIERFYSPDSGTVRFGETDAEEFHLNEWRQSIAYVLQEPQLFNGTVRDNINYGLDRDVLPEETENAAKIAAADEFIRELPDGYDFVIGENGCRLSAGQRQRLAIARAVMLDPSYLLLDEATCNMDMYSEKTVNKALSGLMKGRTTVIISHDMRMLDMADNVVVINNGVIEASGEKDEVIKNSGLLKQLIEANA